MHLKNPTSIFQIAVCRVSSSRPLTEGKVGAKRSDEVYVSVGNPATTKRGVHGVVLFLFPLKWAVRKVYGLRYLLPLPGRGVHSSF